MAIKPTKLTYLIFLIGMVLISMGTGLLYVNRQLSAGINILLGFGLLNIIYSVYRIKISQRLNKEQRKKRVVVGVAICLFIFIYVLANYLAVQYEFRLDLTKYKQHSLMPQTINRLNDLKDNIQLTAFYVGLPPKYLKDMLEEYERQSHGRVVSEIIDPLVQIGYAAQFGSVIDGKKHKLFVYSPKERREVNFTKESLSEESINNAIVQVTRPARTACFLTGHGENRLYGDKETGLNKFVKHMLANNILGREIALDITGGVPTDCDVLIVSGPKNHLTVKEEGIIQKYLNSGGDALFLIENVIVSTPNIPITDDQMDKNPSLNNILREWGVKVSQDVVVDLDSHASGDVGSPATRNYLSHRAIVNGLDYTFFVRPRSIKMLRNRRNSIKLAPLILTASDKKSWGEKDRYLNVQFTPDVDRAGPVPIAFAVMEAHQNEELSDTRIIVITDSDFISNAFIDSYSNAQLGINAINWLTELDYEVYINKKEVKVAKLELTSKQKRIVAFILFLGPFLLISFGMLFWMKQTYAD